MERGQYPDSQADEGSQETKKGAVVVVALATATR